MAFLDNSRDIILDAVLTDLGRKRLSQGDGSFKITKFALGDDEINYTLYDRNNASGSAYFDLEVLQSPVFEAFTNNISTMNSKLLTIVNNNLLFLPVVKLNNKDAETTEDGKRGGVKLCDITELSKVFLVATDQDTVNALTGKIFINGTTPGTNYIRLDQGLDTTEISPVNPLASELIETRYSVEIDNRLGILSFANTDLEPTFIDDDNIALYSFALGVNPPNVQQFSKISDTRKLNLGHTVIGPRGTCVFFTIRATDDIQTTDYLFDTLGSTITLTGITGTFQIIHSTVTITGETTGYAVDVPVSFIKKV